MPDVYFVTASALHAPKCEARFPAWTAYSSPRSPYCPVVSYRTSTPPGGYAGERLADGRAGEVPIGEVLQAGSETAAMTSETTTASIAWVRPAVTAGVRRTAARCMANSPEDSPSTLANRAQSAILSPISATSTEKRDGCVRHSARYDPAEPPCGDRCGTPSTSHRSWRTRRRAILTICCPLAASTPDKLAPSWPPAGTVTRPAAGLRGCGSGVDDLQAAQSGTAPLRAVPLTPPPRSAMPFTPPPPAGVPLIPLRFPFAEGSA